MTDLMKDLEGMEQAALDALAAAATSEGVRLPWPTVYLHWLNGDRKQSDRKDARKFGGWACDAEKVSEVDPAALGKMEQYIASGTEGDYNAASRRTLTVAVIAQRTRWLAKDGKQSSPHYAPGFQRRHIQVLTLAALGEKNDIVLPAVLTAKGFNAKHLLEAFSAWDKAIRPFAAELNAKQLPPAAWWKTIGTTGDKPEFVTVGTDTVNEITPPRAILPDKLDVDGVKRRFIGAQLIRRAAEMLAEAEAWLNAWKDDGERKQAPGRPAEPDEEVPF